jgi:hypothetical protein
MLYINFVYYYRPVHNCVNMTLPDFTATPEPFIHFSRNLWTFSFAFHFLSGVRWTPISRSLFFSKAAAFCVNTTIILLLFLWLVSLFLQNFFFFFSFLHLLFIYTHSWFSRAVFSLISHSERKKKKHTGEKA